MIRSISNQMLAPAELSGAPDGCAPIKTLFLSPAVDDGALIALVLCADRSFRITRNSAPTGGAIADLDDAIALFRRHVRGQ